MVIFEWKGFDKKGAKASGVMDADSAREARAKLKRGGFMVTETNETGPNANRAKRKARKAEKAETKLQAKLRKTLDSARGKGSSQRISKSNLEDVSTFTRQLATLLKAGIPLTEALRAIIEQTTKKRFNMVVRDIRERISQGEPTADALGNHSEFFDDLYVSMVRSGEAAGRLDEVLERLAGFMQGQARVRNKVAAAMAYPIIMLCIGVLVVAALLVLVVPKITTMLEARGEILPLPTRILQNTSDYLVAWWWAFLLLFIFFGLIFNLIYNSEKGRLGIDSKLLKLPLFGDLMTKQALSRFAQTFATLLRSGVPVVRCLEVTETVLGNRLLEHTIQDVRAKILEGADIAGPIKTSGVFP
ncbi:MAG: type II secretion system F family protein, partial [Planctomycetota bacterium]|nr:type II secretion system F family protein [Planctomycetota bacterium]